MTFNSMGKVMKMSGLCHLFHWSSQVELSKYQSKHTIGTECHIVKENWRSKQLKSLVRLSIQPVDTSRAIFHYCLNSRNIICHWSYSMGWENPSLEPQIPRSFWACLCRHLMVLNKEFRCSRFYICFMNNQLGLSSTWNSSATCKQRWRSQHVIRVNFKVPAQQREFNIRPLAFTYYV